MEKIFLQFKRQPFFYLSLGIFFIACLTLYFDYFIPLPDVCGGLRCVQMTRGILFPLLLITAGAYLLHLLLRRVSFISHTFLLPFWALLFADASTGLTILLRPWWALMGFVGISFFWAWIFYVIFEKWRINPWIKAAVLVVLFIAYHIIAGTLSLYMARMMNGMMLG